MAEETHVIRGINWRETFPFVNIFRSFRVAIHPSKLILALLALLSLYVGGRVLDDLWPAKSLGVPFSKPAEEGSQHALNEVDVYGQYLTEARPGDDFEVVRTRMRKRVEGTYAAALRAADPVIPELKDADNAKVEAAAANGDYFSELKSRLVINRNKAVEKATKDKDKRLEEAKKAYDAAPGDKKTEAAKARDEEIKNTHEAYEDTVKSEYRSAYAHLQGLKTIKGQGIFAQFFEFESRQVNGVVNGVLSNNWLGGIRGAAGGDGVLSSVYNFFAVGPMWLMRVHTVYFALFTLLFLLVWAFFGGAISRIAAVHVARDEKLSVRQALKFSGGKLLSFIFAPIIPLIIVLVVGVVVMIGGLIGSIPFIGPILVGILFFLALGAGFVMTLVMLGTGGGFNLMYPTIAVEGSDSFDAISRSFSYVYARPWRMAFYTIVAIIYGALTFLFVRFFIFMLLSLTHKFVGFGMYGHADSLVPVWDAMWPAPTARLAYDIDFLSLSTGQSIAAGLVAFWVYLTISMIGAYAISFYFSSSTIIYYLMRREVDATELDDVYLEQSEDDFTEAAPATTTPATPATGTTASTPVTASVTPATATGIVVETPKASENPPA